MLALLCDAYDEDEIGGEQRTVLRLHPVVAPVKVAVLPLLRKAGQPEVAQEIHATLKRAELRQHWNVEFDDARAIGRRYRRQDEIGTPFCITVDFDSLDDNAVTVRERDSMEQVRVPLAELEGYLAARLIGA